MNSLTVPLYLFGHAGAIRRVASSPMAVPAGILLVFSAGVARNYDQMWFGESLSWLAMPFLFSLASGLWLFFFVFTRWQPRPDGGKCLLWHFKIRHLVSFYGLFWMTAPIAWLYAIPVERWYNPVPAAQWNIRLLTVVALWRIFLMSRVISVIGEMSLLRAFGKVLLPAALETIAVVFVAGFGRQVMAGMGGLRNSPAEDVMISAFSTASHLALIAAAAAFLLQFACRKQPVRTELWRPDPNVRPWHAPYVLLAVVGVLCWRMSIKPQQEQRLNFEAAQLAQRGNWTGLVAFLSQHRKEEFAPSIVLPPSPYEHWGAQTMPDIFRHITPETPAWIRGMYFDYLEVLLPQERYLLNMPKEGGLDKLLTRLEAVEGGRELLRRCAKKLRETEGPNVDRKWKHGPTTVQEFLQRVESLPP